MNNNVKDALRNYKRYKTRAHILDVIAMFPGKDPYFYWDVTGQSTDRTLYRKTNIVEFNLDFQYLVTVGYIQHDKDNNVMSLTDIGIQALRDCTLPNLALAAYNNYLNLKLQRLTVIISMISLVISMISLTIGCLKPRETNQNRPCQAAEKQTFVIGKDTFHVSPYKTPQIESE